MPKFKVLTERCTLADVGQTVDVDDDTADTAAFRSLVDAGHITPTGRKAEPPTTDADDVGQ